MKEKTDEKEIHIFLLNVKCSFYVVLYNRSIDLEKEEYKKLSYKLFNFYISM